ncbi:MAG: cell division protein SepF [Syntrophomonadaceae bacterium]|jgi:cell division inhibitor SepF|nr:cell division protein SepF [Bacillota bacterium]NLM87481.1 cell division protein SepF [Syntrophomonadaceae bacterium]HAA09295.1 cell division protein SepF [Syntrophomonas sp.]HQA49582.1 cell division protein SepF [Syntrophomonadaceae bacterium]HQD90986.1 cell division protein SepF [Syntrophomonadaceae bacterium]
MGIGDKFWSWLGVEHEEVREELLEIPKNLEESRNPANIVSIHTNKTMKVVVCEPESFDEVQILADHLKNRKQVIMNMEATSPEIAQRIIDFLSGTTYALDGHSQQLGRHIFLFTPSNVEITRDHRSVIRRPGWFNTPGVDR